MSLKELGKERILNDMVRGVTSRDKANVKFCAMVVDKAALRVLSACCKVYDLLEDGVTVVEMLAKQRQSLPELEVLYLISPTEESIMRLCEDFNIERRPKYKKCHIFFTTGIPQENELLIRIARATNLVPRIKSFVELNLGFVAYERSVFHLDMPNIGPRLFLDASADGSSNPVSAQEYITMIDRLVTLFTSIGAAPAIRYHTKSQYPRLCEKFAQYVNMRLTQLETQIKEKARHNTNQSIELIIIDRSYDIGSVLAHENTYQAFVYDVFDVPVCSDHALNLETPEPPHGQPSNYGIRSQPKVHNQDDVWHYHIVEKNRSVVRKSILSDEDFVWRKYKHSLLQHVMSSLYEDMRKFVETNSAASMQKKGPGRTDNDEAVRAMRDLPQCTEAVRCFDMHIQINSRANKEIPAQALNRLMPIEDDIITGVDSNGRTVNMEKLLQDTISAILDDMTVTREYNKLRLVLLYIMYTKNVSEEVIQYFNKIKDFSPKSKKILATFINLGFRKDEYSRSHGLDFLQKNKESKKRNEELKHIYADNKEKLERYKRICKTNPHHRRQPDVKELLEDCVYDRNMPERFATLQDSEFNNPRSVGTLQESQADVTLRAKNQVWDWAGAMMDDRQIKDEDSDRVVKNNRKMVLFVIGGLMMSEMRVAQEVAKETKVDIYIGSTAIYTPKNFIEALYKATSPDDIIQVTDAAAAKNTNKVKEKEHKIEEIV